MLGAFSRREADASPANASLVRRSDIYSQKEAVPR